MITLLIKASLVIIVLLAFYKIFLEKESFFAANRLYLLSCLLFACTLPFVALPKLVKHQGFVATLLEPSGSGDIEEAIPPAVKFSNTQGTVIGRTPHSQTILKY
jgi:hypothetical protein